MIISIWVFFMLGEPVEQDHGTAYVQIEASRYMHDVRPDVVEHDCAELFHNKYPGIAVCDSGWCKQSVRVMGG